jgi:signal transduction histidine kinase
MTSEVTNSRSGDGAAAVRGSLQGRILFWMLVIALGPLGLVTWQSYRLAHDAIVGAVEERLRAGLRTRAARMEDWLGERQADIAVMAHLRGRMELDVDEAARVFCPNLDCVRQSTPSYAGLVVYGPKLEEIRRASAGDLRELEVMPAPFRRRLRRASGPVLSETYMRADGSIGLLIGERMQNAADEGVGFVVASLNLNRSVRHILADPAGLGRSGKVYILSADGRYLSAPDSERARHGQPAELPAAVRRSPPGRVQVYRDPDGTEVLGVRSRLPLLDWQIVAEQNTEEAFSWLSRLQVRALVIGLLVALLVVALGLRGAMQLSAPFARLAQVARRVAAGHHEERVGGLDGAEAATVGQAFNQMLDELEEQHRRLVDAAALAAVGKLTSSIVHEMRNPLASIKLNLEALQRKVGADGGYGELAGIARRQTERLERMLEDLLAYGRPVELVVEPVGAERFLEEVRTLVLPAARRRDVRLECRAAAPEARVPMDETQMLRAVSNLVQNAVEHAPPGSRVETLLAPADGGWAVTVADAGPGFPAAQAPRLFEPFFTTREDGTGLGLANVRKIAELHGGRVSAENRPEGGALFRLWLPDRAADAPSSPNPEETE